jgi:hypothetical protein
VWQRTDKTVNQCNSPWVESTAGQCASIRTNANHVAEEQTMTEERKDEQKPWYPRIERVPEIRGVATWQNRDTDDDRLLLEDAEVEENAPVADGSRVSETAASKAPVAPIEPAKD